jgi:hypothetical protein
MTEQLPTPVLRLLDAVRALDTEAFLAVFDQTGFVDDWGRIFSGPDAIRLWSDKEFIGVNVTLEVTDVTPLGDSTKVRAQVGGDGFNGPSHFSFVTVGDQIRSISITA